MILIFSLFLLSFCGECDVSNSSKIDCGYVGVTEQECINKGCCWQALNDIPWCYYKKGAGDCFFEDPDPSTEPFTFDAIKTMNNYFLKNINIRGKGGVVASPDEHTPGGSYYYHWARDGALTMRTVQDIGEFDDYVGLLKSYVSWVQKVHDLTDPHGIDIRPEVKYFLPDPKVFDGGWCRPQTDGPALRAATLIQFANDLINKGQKDYVQENLWTSGSYHGGVIKYDLDWVAENWKQDGCDLWEEIKSNDFFWNRINFKQALLYGAEFASTMGDQERATKYKSAAIEVNSTLLGHWNGNFVFESTNREKDTAVIIGFNDGYYKEDRLFAPSSRYVASTIKTFTSLFCTEYTINQKDTDNKIPGVLYGRYEGDQYAGGNPWILNTASLAELYFRGAQDVLTHGTPSGQAMKIWREIFNNENLSGIQLAKNLSSRGNAVLKRIAYHVKGSGYHLSEQLDRNTGEEYSAADLTWSYANVLKSLKIRANVMKLLQLHE